MAVLLAELALDWFGAVLSYQCCTIPHLCSECSEKITNRMRTRCFCFLIKNIENPKMLHSYLDCEPT